MFPNCSLMTKHAKKTFSLTDSLTIKDTWREMFLAQALNLIFMDTMKLAAKYYPKTELAKLFRNLRRGSWATSAFGLRPTSGSPFSNYYSHTMAFSLTFKMMFFTQALFKDTVKKLASEHFPKTELAELVWNRRRVGWATSASGLHPTCGSPLSNNYFHTLTPSLTFKKMFFTQALSLMRRAELSTAGWRRLSVRCPRESTSSTSLRMRFERYARCGAGTTRRWRRLSFCAVVATLME
mmetsp:Transcript_58139/g.169998  ORF Transcript_58139/g.169998 Transcript_58139/m.169998 type:complete len:238 (+) Transcript_58139:248-961(+)